MATREVSHIFLLLLALLQITTPTPAENTTTTSAPDHVALHYHTQPVDVIVAVEEPAVFRCGVPKASPNLTFTFYGSHGNYSLTCPNGHVEDIPQALYGSCEMKNEESLGVWTLRGTSYSDNGTRVVCQQAKNPFKVTAILRVYDNGISHATLIGCTIGGFFGMLLVAGLSFTMLRRSETLQKCFRGKQTEDDMDTIVTKE
ncbi:uncharacterized protein LOC108888171 [Lates calcarifer]|uniref:Uncharacterized protein LOC108888171 n=1 Tax=Lates calcarifer TaxID=8187 RepID=A0AAJ8BIF6_LATCA|nr:uncharacterized protein LOC108888171 [Lates calcarifer]XP_050932243.1 uncharacterized protein LOC108888171 [Lates calcarifer]